MYYLSAPIGGFGNHVRWLMLLDTSYDIGYADKMDFICNTIYAKTRSWHNWLQVEWQYRADLNKIILFEHKYNPAGKLKTLLLTIDSSLAYRCYLKFNSNLNNSTVGQFKETIEATNQYNLQFENTRSDVKVMSSDVLYSANLDSGFYHSLVDWFGLEDNYSEASVIHRHWFEAHQRAEKEFVSDIATFYK